MRVASIALLTLTGCASHPVEAYSNRVPVVASVYWQPQGTSCGGRFNPNAMTFAHKTLPCRTRARFSVNGRTVEAVVNDRGPYVKGRDVDLSDGTAKALGLGRSVHKIHMEVLR